jgi:hypothetical protein
MQQHAFAKWQHQLTGFATSVVLYLEIALLAEFAKVVQVGAGVVTGKAAKSGHLWRRHMDLEGFQMHSLVIPVKYISREHV